MTITLITLIIVLCTFSLLFSGSQTQIGGSSYDASSSQLIGFDYVKKQNELDNVDKVLERPVRLGKTIVQLLDSEQDPVDSLGRTGRKIKRISHILDWCPPIDKTDANADIDFDLIQYRQPYMFDKPALIRGRYYRDWRYPEKPVDIKFLKNPKAYCKSNPFQYPCVSDMKKLSL